MSKADLFGGASVQGAAHKLRGLINQDAFGGAEIGKWIVLAVSDGHGAAPHYRSDRGARFAVQAVQQVMGALNQKESFREQDAARFPSLLVEIWRKLVAADVKAEPLERPAADIFIPYGATCLAACLGADFTFYAQIGDGDMVAASSDGALQKPLPDDVGLTGQQTYSLCQADAVSHFRVSLQRDTDRLAAPAFLLLASDGLSKSYPRGTQFFDTVHHLAELANDRGAALMSQELPPWLDEVSENGSGDDITVMLFKDAGLHVFAKARAASVVGKLKRLLRLH